MRCAQPGGGAGRDTGFRYSGGSHQGPGAGMKLSKTNFLIWRDCRHDAWMKVHRPAIYNAVPLSDFDQSIIDGGNEVDVLAREVFPGGVTVPRKAAAQTAELVAARTAVLYQPVFETDHFTTACDILVWNEAGAAYDLYEVKGSTSGGNTRAKDELYTWDIGFQAEVLRRQGVPLGRLNLVRLNSGYVRDGDLDLDALFTAEDFTDAVEAMRDEISAQMDAAHDDLSLVDQPGGPCGCFVKARGQHCRTFGEHNPNVPAYSVHDITRIGASKKKLTELLERGVLRIEDVPEDVRLSPVQANQVRAAQTGRPAVAYDEVADFLAALTYPISFLDYETFAAGVPRFDGYGPFHHIPFQFSLDVVSGPDAVIEHHEFLHPSDDKPDVAFLEALKAGLPGRGSIVVWNQSFERGVNDKLGERNPDYADWLADVDVRVVDLMEVFSQQSYVHPGFLGRTSIKYVLPVLVPELSYKGLGIQEGGTASIRWNAAVTGKVSAEEAAKIRADLLAYCGLDSRAMLEIWRALQCEIAPVLKTG